LQTQALTEAVRAGIARVPEIEIALVMDLVRDFGPERAARTLHEAREVRDLGVVGIGLGGSEQDYPPELFAGVFAEASRLGFHTTAHAGEAAGAPSIWGALRALQAERIGHGTRAYEDERLLDYLAAQRIPIEMCPLSNICTGVVPRLADHPVRRYFEQGLFVTINTDDPKMFGNSLAVEYQSLERDFGFSRAEIRQLVENAVQASWLPADKKARLSLEVRQDPAWEEAITSDS
jgi:adenosine deaminase